MKYAIILECLNGDKYLKGFSNTEILYCKDSIKRHQIYTVELKELSSLFIPLEGDAKIYLS